MRYFIQTKEAMCQLRVPRIGDSEPFLKAGRCAIASLPGVTGVTRANSSAEAPVGQPDPAPRLIAERLHGRRLRGVMTAHRNDTVLVTGDGCRIDVPGALPFPTDPPVAPVSPLRFCCAATPNRGIRQRLSSVSRQVSMCHPGYST